jgi:hypothetical protein
METAALLPSYSSNMKRGKKNYQVISIKSAEWFSCELPQKRMGAGNR